MNKIFNKFLLGLFLFVLPITLFSQKNVDLNKLDEALLKGMNELNETGLAVGIIKDGKVVFAKGYGYKNFETKDTVTTKTLFAIASCSKAFTAACIGMLVDEGKLDWNDRVIDHLPGFQLSDPYVTRELRIVDLLTHRAGYNTFDGDLLWYGTNYSSDEIIKRFKGMPAKKSLRISYGYSNVMFIVAGEVIEAITGKTWDDFVKERILNPVGMKTTTTTNSVFNKNMDIAIPHIKKRPIEFLNYDNVGPAASLNSSVDDLLKWLQMWLDKGEVKENELISEKTWQRILRSETALNGGKGDKIGEKHFSNAAMGWFLSDYAGRKIIAHSGGLPGFLSRVIFVPEDNLGIVVLTNDESGSSAAATNTILDTYLTDKNVDRFAEIKKLLEKREEGKAKKNAERRSSRARGTNPSLTLEKYSGTYEDKIYGKASVLFENDELTLVLEPAKELFTSKMNHWHYDTFSIKFKDPFLPSGLVTFELDNKGKVSAFKIDLPNPDFHFYNFHFKKID